METIVRRPADISPIEAKQGLALAYPTAKVDSFDTVTENGQMIFVAKLITSEFPLPAEGGGEDEPDGDDAPPFAKSDDSDSDDSDSDDKPKSEKKEKGDGVGKKIDKLEKLVEQMAQAMGIPVDTGEGDEDGPPVPPGADAGDGADVPPPPPVADDAPLPPPAAPKGAPGGGGLGMPFSSVDHFAGDQHVAALRHDVAGRRSFSMAFEDGGVSARAVCDTARGMFPDFELKRIESREGVIDGGEPQAMYVLGMVRR